MSRHAQVFHDTRLGVDVDVDILGRWVVILRASVSVIDMGPKALDGAQSATNDIGFQCNLAAGALRLPQHGLQPAFHQEIVTLD